MRPRRRLVLFSIDQPTLDTVGFALDLFGFRISTASTLLELDGILFYEQPQALLILEDYRPIDIDGVIRAARQRLPNLRTCALVRDLKRRWQVCQAEIVLVQPEIAMIELRESLRILMNRKRGPKKQRPAVREVAIA